MAVKYTNSPLVNYTKISPNKTSPRNHKIDTITIHCVVGQCTVEALGAVFAPATRKGSSNYGVGKDGRIGMYVEEKDRSWCSSNAANDHRAITIEVASDTTHPYAVTDAAYKALINLVADICKRNGIKKLVWSTNKDDRINHKNGCNMTVHRDYANKACVPTYSEVLTRDGWVKLSDIQIGDEIACADLDNLRITFEEVYDKVPVRTQDTYTNNELTATKDHRMVYSLQKSKDFRKIDAYNTLLAYKGGIYIPLAGYSNFDGLPLTNEMISFYVAMQADGCYMYEKNKLGEKRYYGVEFHLSKERKIERLIEILDACHFDYKETKQQNGTTKIRIYNQDGINIVNDICEKYLHDKAFTWEWLNLSPEQAKFFLDELLYWDGCASANSYCSKNTINLDVVNAIAAINGVGSRVIGNNVQFRETPYITLGEKTVRNNHKGRKTEVSCVSVKTGIFLMRQDGKTFIVGNCPGDYLYSRHGQIAEEVNKRLGVINTTSSPSTANNKILYRIQVGAFSNTTNVKSYLEKVKKAGFDAFIVKVGNLYKIQVGAFGVKSNAESFMKKVKSAGFNAFLTTESGEIITSIESNSDEIKVGDKVKLKSNVYVYGTKTKFASFVYNSTLYVRQINGDKVVISTQKTGAVTGTVSKNDLIKI